MPLSFSKEQKKKKNFFFHNPGKKVNNHLHLKIQLPGKRSSTMTPNFLSSPLCLHTYFYMTCKDECFPPKYSSE